MTRAPPPIWLGRRVLVTGHTGFKGAWAALWLHRLGAHVTGLALEPTLPTLFGLTGLGDMIVSRYADLRKPSAIQDVIDETQPEAVLHLAGQPLVSRGFQHPAETFAVNVMGTVHLLDALRRARDLRAVLVATTDKVYAADDTGRAFTESDRLGGTDPYAASKAATELAVVAMARSFLAPSGVAVATARGGNVIGGGDFTAGRLVPDVVAAARAGTPLGLRHAGATRPWQHVLDCLHGYLTYLAALTTGQDVPLALNFGPSTVGAVTVTDLAGTLLQALRPGLPSVPAQSMLPETPHLAISSERARAALGWSPTLTTAQMISLTAAWYQSWAEGQSMQDVTLRQIAAYEAMQ